MFGYVQDALLDALFTAPPYVLPVLVIAVGVRYWWEWRRASRPQR